MNNRIEEELIDNMARQEENFNDALSMIAKFNNNLIKEAKKQARKETAREILLPLYNRAKNNVWAEARVTQLELRDILKEYGVEVE